MSRWVALLWLLLIPLASAEPLTVIVSDDVLADYHMFIANRDPATLDNFAGPGARRDVAELLLLQQALAAGGCQDGVIFNSAPSYERILHELALGRSLISGNTAWRDDLDSPQLLVSSALISDGEFEAGIYSVASNKRAFAVRDLVGLRQLTAVSSRSWHSDWRTLSKLGLKALYTTSTWDNMLRMTASQRVDVLLAPFHPTTDLGFDYQGQRFLPIAGIKVGLAGSRHFALSRQDKRSARILQQLNAGIQLLRQRGTINRAYRQSGFFNAQVAGWQRLN